MDPKVLVALLGWANCYFIKVAALVNTDERASLVRLRLRNSAEFSILKVAIEDELDTKLEADCVAIVKMAYAVGYESLQAKGL